MPELGVLAAPTLTMLLGQKNKVVLFQQIGRVKTFFFPTHLHKSHLYENIYFLFQKNIQKQISTSKFICTNLHFFSSSNSGVRVAF